MAAVAAIRLLRLLPVLSSSVTLMFAVDEHIFLGTWMHPEYRARANAHLPDWFTHWGRRGRWVILLGYPANYSLAVLNLLVARRDSGGSLPWYGLGLLFSFCHIAIFAKRALGLLADIKADRPKGNSTHSMGVWLKMNWVRALVTDFPAWVCFIVAALKAL
jgi:hypothetical protein